jgi:hypothetical protein
MEAEGCVCHRFDPLFNAGLSIERSREEVSS